MKRDYDLAHIDEQIEEKLLIAALLDAPDPLQERIDQMDDDEFQVSEEQFRRDEERILHMMERQQREQRRKVTRRKLARVGKLAAMLVLVAVLSVGALAMTVEAFRTDLFNFFTEIYENYILAGRGEYSELPKEIDFKDAYFPEYLPEGFKLSSVRQKENYIVTEYKNGKQEFSLRQYIAPSLDIIIDVEDANIISRAYEIDGMAAILIEKGNILTFAWGERPYFQLEGKNIGVEELLAVANSLEHNGESR